MSQSATRGIENDLVHMVWYSSLSFLCNKLSYCASQSPTGFDQAKSEIEKLMIQMEGLSNIVGEGNNFEKHEDTSSLHVWDPNIIKTKGDPGKLVSNI